MAAVSGEPAAADGGGHVSGAPSRASSAQAKTWSNVRIVMGETARVALAKPDKKDTLFAKHAAWTEPRRLLLLIKIPAYPHSRALKLRPPPFPTACAQQGGTL